MGRGGGGGGGKDSRTLQEVAAVLSVASCQGDRDNLGLGRLVLNE